MAAFAVLMATSAAGVFGGQGATFARADGLDDVAEGSLGWGQQSDAGVGERRHGPPADAAADHSFDIVGLQQLQVMIFMVILVIISVGYDLESIALGVDHREVWRTSEVIVFSRFELLVFQYRDTDLHDLLLL
jgi:hypothetical protein